MRKFFVDLMLAKLVSSGSLSLNELHKFNSDPVRRLLSQEKLSLDEVKALTEAQLIVLNNSLVMNLIQTYRLTLDRALRLTVEELSVISSRGTSWLVESGVMTLDDVLNLAEAERRSLADFRVRRFVVVEKFPVDVVLKTPELHRYKFFNKTIRQLLMHDGLSLKQVIALTKRECRFIARKDQVFQLVFKGFITIKEAMAFPSQLLYLLRGFSGMYLVSAIEERGSIVREEFLQYCLLLADAKNPEDILLLSVIMNETSLARFDIVWREIESKVIERVRASLEAKSLNLRDSFKSFCQAGKYVRIDPQAAIEQLQKKSLATAAYREYCGFTLFRAASFFPAKAALDTLVRCRHNNARSQRLYDERFGLINVKV